MRMNGSPYHLLVHSMSLPQASTMVTFEQAPPVEAHISAGVHPGTEALVEATIPIMNSMIYRTGARRLSSEAPCYSRPSFPMLSVF
jgi:hypothetical protein